MATNEIRPCPGCHGRSSSALGSANRYEIRDCSGCGTIFTAGLPAQSEAKDYEDFYSDARDVPVPPFVLVRLEQTVASLEQYRSLNRWLDIGCGTGTLLQALANRGWHPVGTEVAPAAVDNVRARGFETHLGETGELDLADGDFDVISLTEVVEHLHDPDSVVCDAARLVRPGGGIYLTTPNGRSLSARMLHGRWSVVTPPDHLQLFSPGGLGAVLTRAGFVVRRTWAHGLNPYELRAAIEYGRNRPAGHGHTKLSYQLNESLSTNRAGTIVKTVVNGALTATRLGDTLKVLAERPQV